MGTEQDFSPDVEALRRRVQQLESEKRTAYSDGFIAGLKEFAHWKDGTQYVGTCGKTLNQAVEEFLGSPRSA